MTSDREVFLKCVRQAVAEGNRAGTVPSPVGRHRARGGIDHPDQAYAGIPATRHLLVVSS